MSVRYDSLPTRNDVVVITCSDYAQALRQYSVDGKAELHRFDLRVPKQAVGLRLTTVGQLQALVDDQRVKRFDFDDVRLR